MFSHLLLNLQTDWLRDLKKKTTTKFSEKLNFGKKNALVFYELTNRMFLGYLACEYWVD